LAALLPKYLGLDKPGKHSGRLPFDWGGVQARTNSLDFHNRENSLTGIIFSSYLYEGNISLNK